MPTIGLDFEKPIIELERRIEELKSYASAGKLDLTNELRTLEAKLERIKRETYQGLTPWQRVQLARHPMRPYTLDYIAMLTTGFEELHGDRLFGDDKAIVGGFARVDEAKLLFVGHQKGRDTKENLMRNFGCAHPEGYRKALRLMRLAEKFDIPIVTFIDTPGAYPGIGAEERGQAHSIAENLKEMMETRVPIICFVIGEGGSGGALGIGVGDRICVLENAYYSVISPEGCAAILWKDRSKSPEAADALKMTARDLLEAKVIDEVIEEPMGGAHRNPKLVADNIKRAIKEFLKDTRTLSKEKLLEERYLKFRRMGIFEEPK